MNCMHTQRRLLFHNRADVAASSSKTITAHHLLVRTPRCWSTANSRNGTESLRQIACTAVAGAGKPATPAGPPTQVLGIPPEIREAGGLDPSTQPEESSRGYAQSLAQMYLPVNLQHKGLRVLNLDPPLLVIDNFVSAEVCENLMTAAGSSGRMAVSKVGGAGPNAPDNIRTSRTLAMTKDVLDAVPAIQTPLDNLLSTASQLIQLQMLGQDSDSLKRSLFSKPSNPGQVVPELPQVAHYQPGQHFLTHEDAFPPAVALQKGYQRRATLLVYLNDVAEGGATYFDKLGFGIRPKQGSALLFFPSFSGGMPDARTLHTAQDAVSEKWVFQLWLTSGLPKPKVPAGRPGTASTPGKPKKKRK